MSEVLGTSQPHRLGDVCLINPSKPDFRGITDDTPVMFVPMAAVDEISGTIVNAQARTLGDVRTKSYRTFTSGDVLFAKITPCMENGKSAIVPKIDSGIGFGSTEFHVLRVRTGTDARLVWHFLRQESLRRAAREHMTGSVGQARVPSDYFDMLTILLPAYSEQSRTADLLDAITAASQSAVDHCSHAVRAIDAFRQAALTAACSGRLTADWRESNEPIDGTGLVEHLRGVSDRNNLLDVEADPTREDEYPANWELANLGMLIERIEAGKSFAVHGRSATADEWGIIKVSAMSWGEFRENENKAIPEGHAFNPSYEIKTNDLLISRANTVDLVGATVLVKTTRPHLLLSDKSLRLIPHKGIDKAWLNYTLRSQMVRTQFAERATGTSDSMRNLSQDKIRATTVPLPSATEQIEIACRLDRLMEMADQVESKIESSRRVIDQVAQSVFAKVFSVGSKQRIEPKNQ